MFGTFFANLSMGHPSWKFCALPLLGGIPTTYCEMRARHFLVISTSNCNQTPFSLSTSGKKSNHFLRLAKRTATDRG